MDDIKKRVKQLMVDNLMLTVGVEEIGDGTPLFGPGGLGLDSVDALQLIVALDKTFDLKVADPAEARAILTSVNSIVAAVERHLASQGQRKTEA